MRRLVAMALALASLATLVAGVTGASRAAAADNASAESQFVDLLNRARADRGLPTVIRDTGLDGVARDWSAKMSGVYAATNVVTGTSTDCSTHALCHRPNLADAIGAVEPAWQKAGENIGTGYDVQSLHDAFMSSPGHYANIVGDYNRLGVGVVTDADGRIWVTFDFLLGPAVAALSQPFSAPPPPTVVPLGYATRFTPVTPTRVADTRFTSGLLGGNTVLVLDLAHDGFVPGDATGAAINLTAVGAPSDGYLTAYPCGRTAPDVSNVNFTAGSAVPNLVTVALGAGGAVCVVASTPTNVIADLAGWYAGSGQRYHPAVPERLLDSRASGPATSFRVKLPATVGTDAGAVTLNVTVDGPAATGFVTAYPCGIAPPNASNLNFDAGETVPNQVTVRVGDDRSVCFAASATTNLIVDLSGWFGADGAAFTPVVPTRFLDTRFGAGGWKGRVGAGQTVDVAVGGVSGIPATAAGAVLNVTVAGSDAAGFLTVYPCDEPRPNASNLNFVPGRAVANAVTVKAAATGRLCVYASSRADVLVDLAGYLAS